MESERKFWGRTMKQAFHKYLGWDWRIIPLSGFLGSIGFAVYLRNPWIGYVALVILFVCIVLAEHDIWAEDMEAFKSRLQPLELLKQENDSFRQKQAENIRNYIHPILIEVDWDIANIDSDQWKGISIKIAFANFLVFEQPISRLTGDLFIECCTGIRGFEFRDAPPRLLPVTISNSFSEMPLLPESIKSYIRKLWQANKRKPAIKLTLRMERPDGDPINFDPSGDHPLRLSISAGGK